MKNQLKRRISVITLAATGGLWLNAWPLSAQADLGGLLHAVEQHSPALRASESKAEASQSGLKAAKGKYWGEMDVFASDLRYNERQLVTPIVFPPNVAAAPFDDSQYAYGVSLKLPLDINGGIHAAVENAGHEAKAAEFAATNQRLQLMFKGAELYRNLQRLVGQKMASEKQISALQKHLEVADAGVRVGRMAPVERLRIATDLESVRGQLADLDGKIAANRAGVAALINQTSFDEPIQPPEQPPKKAVTDTHTTDRPDLLQAKEQAEASAAGVKQAHSKRLPNLNINAAAQHIEGYDADGGDIWSITTRIALPLWDGRTLRSDVDRAEALRRAAVSGYLAKKLQARAEIESARSSWKAAEKRYESATQGVTLADETSRIQSDRFANGRISAADLVDAEAALAKARAAQSSALADWWGADDSLRLATGKAPRAYDKTSRKN